MIWIAIVVVGVHSTIGFFRAKTLARAFTLDFCCKVNVVIVVNGALKLYAARAVLLTRTFAGWFPAPQKTILAGSLVLALREQETGIVRVEVTVGSKKVEHQAGRVVLTKE